MSADLKECGIFDSAMQDKIVTQVNTIRSDELTFPAVNMMEMQWHAGLAT